MLTPKRLIKEAGQLFSLPEVCLRINQLLDDPRSSAKEMADVLVQDTALSAHLLRIVNSAFYGLPRRIETISRAITIIGTKDLRNLAVISIACDLFRGIAPELISMEVFWRNSIATGVIARALAQQCNVLHPERLFVMGVLHDIGRLVIYQQLPQQARDILLISKGRDDLIISSEMEILGFTHSEVGYELAQHWQLPDTISNTIRWHHNPDKTDDDHLEVALVHISTVIADLMTWQDNTDNLESAVNSSAWQTTGLDVKTCREIEGSIGGEIRELFNILMGDAYSVSGQ